MTAVTVRAGERTIGGTQILVEDGGVRLLFDCGLAYDPAGNPFGVVQQRPGQELADLLRLGLAPYILGLYSPDFLQGMRGPRPPDGPLAVALSHSHLDHSHLVGFVDPSVPVYASPATVRLLGAMSDLGELLHAIDRPLIAVSPAETFDVGPMRVTLLPVDHDVSGARGMIIETTEGVIAYSGDLRLHGDNPMYTLSFARAVRDAGAKLLILEGTRLFPPPDQSVPPTAPVRERVEADVAPEVVRALADRPDGLGVILMSPGNGERVEAIAAAVAQSGRTFVLDLEGLTLAVAALGRPIEPPHAVYLPRHLAAVADEGRLPPAMETALRSAPRRLTAADMAGDRASYLLRLSFNNFADLVDLLGGGPAGTLITSNAVPLGRFDPAWGQMEWWAARFDLTIVDASCTGHATPRDLALIAAQSGAPTVMSIHSFHPELMPVPPERLLLPERGRAYDLRELAPA